jgi:hypothetical protein
MKRSAPPPPVSVSLPAHPCSLLAPTSPTKVSPPWLPERFSMPFRLSFWASPPLPDPVVRLTETPIELV